MTDEDDREDEHDDDDDAAQVAADNRALEERILALPNGATRLKGSQQKRFAQRSIDYIHATSEVIRRPGFGKKPWHVQCLSNRQLAFDYLQTYSLEAYEYMREFYDEREK